MESKINELIDGMMLQIKTYGIKGPTITLYQNVCNTIVKYAIVTGDEHYSEQLVESFLADREQRNKDGLLCNEYLRFIKRVTKMLKSFAATGETDFSSSRICKKYKVSLEHQRLTNKILGHFSVVNSTQKELDAVIRHFFCSIEEKNIQDKDISDSDFFNFLSSVSESNKGSMGRTLRALKYTSAYLIEHEIADL